MLNHLARNGQKAQIVEAHGGKGVYVSSNPHLRRAREAAQYSTSILGRAQAECFAAPPGGLGVVADLVQQAVGCSLVSSSTNISSSFVFAMFAARHPGRQW